MKTNGCLIVIGALALLFGPPFYIFPAKGDGGWLTEEQGFVMLGWLIAVGVVGYRFGYNTARRDLGIHDK
jgi:hypothetical protein